MWVTNFEIAAAPIYQEVIRRASADKMNNVVMFIKEEAFARNGTLLTDHWSLHIDVADATVLSKYRSTFNHLFDQVLQEPKYWQHLPKWWAASLREQYGEQHG